MIEKNTQSNTEELRHRRKGSAFDTLAKILRGISSLVFNSGIVIQNRLGVSSKEQIAGSGKFTKSKSVFEVYQSATSLKREYNIMKIGEKGTGDFGNTNVIDIISNGKIGEKDVANGYVAMTSKNNEDDIQAKIILYNPSLIPAYTDPTDITTEIKGEHGGRVEIVGQLGNSSVDDSLSGGVQLTLVGSSGQILMAFVVDKDGIQMYGLPTTLPTTPNTIWNDSGTLKIS